jgi:hypothetical protein
MAFEFLEVKQRLDRKARKGRQEIKLTGSFFLYSFCPHHARNKEEKEK